jgi:hypothetical protein
MVTYNEQSKKGYLKKIGIVSTWMKKKRKILKFKDAGSNNLNEREWS